jgi:uncharacterized protein with HEPN domain
VPFTSSLLAVATADFFEEEQDASIIVPATIEKIPFNVFCNIRLVLMKKYSGINIGNIVPVLNSK